MPKFVAPTPPYLGPAAHSTPGHNKPITRIVLHSTVSPTVEGGARKIAAYFRTAAAGGSAHYVVDPGEVVQVVYDDVIAWHAPPNQHSLGIEMCDEPVAGDPGMVRWQDKAHKRMLTQVIHLAAELCLAYDVPPVWLSIDDLKAGKHGITSHNNVSQTWHESTHWDPGWFPEDAFIDRLAKRVAKLQREAAK